MLQRLTAAALLGTALSGAAIASGGRPVSVGEIRAVTLSSGGLAEVFRSARVTGDGTISLQVPIDQVDDILKSLVVQDTAGTVVGMTLGGASPIEETFRRLPFSPEDLGDVGRLAGALQGTAIKASSAGRMVSGRSLGMSVSRTADGKDTRLLSVLADDGTIQVIELGGDATITILDETMRQKVAEAVGTLEKDKVAGARTVEIRLKGNGERDVGLTYVVPASIWKTAYRVVTGQNGGKARLQGWAVIENSTGEDWKDVRVTLSSGSPVTLKQRLHQPVWRDRPEVPVDGGAPQVDNGMPVTGSAQMARGRGPRAVMMAAPVETAPEMAPAEMAPASESVKASEGDVSASYSLPNTVTLRSGDTLSVPIIDGDVVAERVSVFHAHDGGKHPIAALMVRNESSTSLPPGIVTVYDATDGFIGDARLPAIAAGRERMARFATDQKVEISTSERPEGTITRVTVADGMLKATKRVRLRTTYTIKGAPDSPRTVVIEHPVKPGWELSTDAHAVTEEDGVYRLSRKVSAGEIATVQASLERSTMETVRTSDIDADMLIVWSHDVEDKTVAEKLRELAEARRQLAAAERELRKLEEDMQWIERDQARIRENLKAAPPNSELASRYITQMQEMEQDLSDKDRKRKEALEIVRQRKEEFSDVIRTL